MKRAMTFAFAVMCVLAGTILAQPESKMSKPGPEHKRLAYYVGSWTTEGEMKQSPFGPGGKFTSTEHNEWFPGEFFLVSHATGKGPMGPMNELAVMGYAPEEKVYTYDGYNSRGEHEVSKGTVQGDTWTWTGESKVQGKTIRGRFISKHVSPSSYTFTYDYSIDGSTWTNAMEGKATKVK